MLKKWKSPSPKSIAFTCFLGACFLLKSVDKSSRKVLKKKKGWAISCRVKTLKTTANNKFSTVPFPVVMLRINRRNPNTAPRLMGERVLKMLKSLKKPSLKPFKGLKSKFSFQQFQQGQLFQLFQHYSPGPKRAMHCLTISAVLLFLKSSGKQRPQTIRNTADKPPNREGKAKTAKKDRKRDTRTGTRSIPC